MARGPAETAVPSGRPRRHASQNVDYKEKRESDIPLVRTGSKQPHTHKKSPQKRRSVSSRGSTQPQALRKGKAASTGGNSTSSNSQMIPVDSIVPTNWQPPLTDSTRYNYIPDFATARMDRSNTILTFKDGTKVRKGDCIYMVCEPPSEPFYIAVVTGFPLREGEPASKQAKAHRFEVLWFYRPRDIYRRPADSRMLYATVHKDFCPISSFRGFATVKHTSEIEDLEAFKSQPNCFYFNRLYDRYMMKSYEVLPTNLMKNLSPNYYKALNKRFPYVFVEVGSGEELLSSPRTCGKCHQWCPGSDSVQCFDCGKTYHLFCLDPPITKKPKRGFAWYCAACSRAMEQKLSAKRGDMLESAMPSHIMADIERQQQSDLSSSEPPSSPIESSDVSQSLPTSSDEVQQGTEGAEIKDSEAKVDLPRYEQLAIQFLENDKGLTVKKRRQLEEWPWRYLGVHARLEDVLDLQDRPYPRASSRLGSKYQCTGIPDWYGHTVQYYDSAKKASYRKRGKKRSRYRSNSPQVEDDPLAKKPMAPPAEFANTNPADYPGWLQPRPKGFIERGGDETATLLWDEPKGQEDMVEDYIKKCEPVARSLDLLPNTPNFVDAILQILMDNSYDPEKALPEVQKLTRSSLKEPTFSPDEVQRFEDSVRVHGDELYPVYKDVGTQSSAMVVRFYYLWKKTKNGHLIWDNYKYRPKNRLKFLKNGSLDLDDPADDAAYNTKKVVDKGVKFECLYCKSGHSPQWFRAPGATLPKTASEKCLGLCYRCSRLWRRYAVEWQSYQDLLNSYPSINLCKKKTDSELVEDSEQIQQARDRYTKHPKKATPSNLKQLESVKDMTIDNVAALPTSGRQRSPQVPAPVSTATPRTKRKNGTDHFEVTVPLKKKAKKRTKSAGNQPKAADVDVKMESQSDLGNNYSRQEVAPAESEVDSVIAADGVLDTDDNSIADKIIEKRMFDRYYSSRYDLFNPFKKDAGRNIEQLPMYQTRNAAREIACLWSNRKRRQVNGREREPKAVFPPSSRPCCVCRQFGGEDEILICSNCGLNVHASCYGVNLSEVPMKHPSYTYVWHCDSCSNDVHPIVSTHYICELCNARESNHDSSLKGDPDCVPDALKRTPQGRWVHVQCALLSPGVTFGNSEQLQPVYGTDTTNFRNWRERCALCHGFGGGLVKCKFCENKLHVTCCQDCPDTFIGFTLVPSPNGNVVIDGVVGYPEPVAVCREHIRNNEVGTTRLYDIRTEVKFVGTSRSKQMPLINAYARIKREPHPLRGGEQRRKVYSEMLDIGRSAASNGGVGFVDGEADVHRSVSPPQFECSFCHNNSTLLWHSIPQHGMVCHQCYVRKQNGADLTDAIPTVSSAPGAASLSAPQFGIPSLDDRYGSTSQIPVPAAAADSELDINLHDHDFGHGAKRISINDILS